MPLIETADVNLWIADYRPDDSRPIALIIHGAGGSHESFPAELRQLRRVNPVLADLCGHGNSPGDGYDSISNHARDMAALLDKINSAPAVVIGHSMGGAIAQMMALEYPERVSALVLIATAAKFRVNPALLSDIVRDFDGTVDALNRWLWRRDTPSSQRRDAVQAMRETDPAVFQRDFIACDRFDVRARLAEIRAKALILAGEDDKMTPHALADALESGIPQADLVTFPGGSHMFMLEQARATVDAIDSWLARVL